MAIVPPPPPVQANAPWTATRFPSPPSFSACCCRGVRPSPPTRPSAADPDIARLVRDVSPARLEIYVRTLAGFGTRHSLSAPTIRSAASAPRAAGSRPRWTAARRSPGARLKVEFDEFVQEPSPRVPKPVPLVNVVATLEGVDPQAKARTLVVSGHYDSMCGNVMNAECDAPGANDDASGTAVAMELACMFAKSRFPATLVFMAVAGEEQGLLGAAHWAKVGARARHERRGDDHQRHRRQRARRDRPPRCDHAAAVRRGRAGRQAVTEEWQQRLATGGENDSPARELARTIRDAAARYVPD